MENREKISRYLTDKVLKKCWHEWENIPYKTNSARNAVNQRCRNCGKEIYCIHPHTDAPINCLDTLEGIFVLIKAGKEEDWWGHFEYTTLFNPDPDEPFYLNYDNLFNLPEVMYEFLKASEGGCNG